MEHTGLFHVESVATADLDKEVVVSYAAIHCGLTNELIESYENYPSKEEMAAELTAKRLGYDFKNDKPYDWYKLSRKKDKTKGIEKYWLADHLSHNLGDMMQIDALPDCDFLTYSCPCFTADTLVLTNNGLKKIVDITTNDKVLTHNNEYKEVLDSKCTGEKNIYIIDAMCSNKIECTGNHKFLVREMYRTYPTYNNGKRGNVRHFKDPEWIECEKLSKKHYLGMAINQKSIPNEVLQIGNIAEGKSGWDNPQTGRIYSIEGCSPTLNTCNGGGHEPKIVTTTRGSEIASCVRASYFKNGSRNIEENIKSGKGYEGIIEKYGCDKSHNSPQIIERANCLTTVQKDNLVMEGELLLQYIRIRKLTPKECHRLMGFDDIDVNRCKAVGMSDAQGYKQAGNSIVTNVIALIAEHFYKAQYDESYECLDEKMANFQKPQME